MKEEIENAITDIDDVHIVNALDYKAPTQKRTKFGKKLVVLVAAVVALNSLVGFATGYSLRHYIGKNWAMVSLQVDKNGNMISTSSLNYDLETNTPYRVDDGQIYFTHDGSNRNITDFCSIYDSFVYVDVDFWGNGNYIVVGGTPDNLGFTVGNVIGGKRVSSVTLYPAIIENGNAPRMNENTDSKFYGLVQYSMNHYWKGAIEWEEWVEKFNDTNLSPEERAEFELMNKPHFDYVITMG